MSPLDIYPLTSPPSKKSGLKIYPIAATFHPDTLSWRDRALATGGILDDVDYSGIDAFVVEMHRLGLRNANGNHILLDVLPFAGRNLPACLTKLWHLASAPEVTNFNFLEGDYIRTSGLTGDGTSKYLNSNIILAGILDNSVSFGIYNRTLGANFGVEIGASSETTNYNERLLFHSHFFSPGFANNPIVDCFSSANNRINNAVQPAIFTNVLYYTRHSFNSANLYHKGVIIGQDSNPNTGTTPNIPLFYFAENAPTGAGGFSPRSLGFIFVGAAIPSNLNAAFTGAVEKLMSDLGRVV